MTKQIAVVGTGYVGLVSGACFASVGYTVTCFDIDTQKIRRLACKEIPIYEPQLDELVIQAIENNKLFFTTNVHTAVSNASTIILAVDTPKGKDGQCDITNIIQATKNLSEHILQDVLIVIKSTVPVGTAEYVENIVQEVFRKRKVSYAVEVVSNPEFLREGAAVHDFMHPDRIILGISSKKAEQLLLDLYAPFHHNKNQFILMDRRSSELTKYAANTMLACRISFMNYLSILCDATGADVESIRKGIGSDARIGEAFLAAGVGFGGSCFPKDIAALLEISRDVHVPAYLVEAIERTNMDQKKVLSGKIQDFFEDIGGLSGKKIAILGLSFKPNTDDMREASSLVIIEELRKQGAFLALFDPVAIKNAQKIIPPGSDLSWHSDIISAITDADAIAIITEWDVCKQLTFEQCKKYMRSAVIFDGRNIFDIKDAQKAGVTYISIGRTPVAGKKASISCSSIC